MARAATLLLCLLPGIASATALRPDPTRLHPTGDTEVEATSWDDDSTADDDDTGPGDDDGDDDDTGPGDDDDTDGPTPFDPDDVWEQNDGLTTPAEVGCPLQLDAYGDDPDWYQFAVEAPVVIEARLQWGPGPHDLELLLHRGLVSVATADATDELSQTIRSGELPAGTYTVGVVSRRLPVTYTLTVQCVATPADPPTPAPREPSTEAEGCRGCGMLTSLWVVVWPLRRRRVGGARPARRS